MHKKCAFVKFGNRQFGLFDVININQIIKQNKKKRQKQTIKIKKEKKRIKEGRQIEIKNRKLSFSVR